MKTSHFFAIIASWMFVTSCKEPVSNKKEPEIGGPTDFQRMEQKYRKMEFKIPSTAVCPGVTPVHIFREENGQKFWHATGAQLSGDNAILTCGHAFWDIPGDRKKPWKFYYQVLQPYEKKFRPIQEIVTIGKVENNNVNASRDVIACIPGEAKTISPIAAPEAETQQGLLTFKGFVPMKKTPVRSTVTGEVVNLIGTTQLLSGPGYFVLDYESVPGESGTLFASPDNKKVYIISRSVRLDPDLRKVFGLGEEHKFVTFCSSVILN